MIKWFKDMRRKQKESDRLLEMHLQEKRTHVKDKRTQLRNHALSLARDYKKQMESIKRDYNITDEEIDAIVGKVTE